MRTLEIILILISVIIIIAGFLLSRSGGGGGLSAISGQDMELFKKSKSRGFLKYVQIAMFILGLTLMIVALVLLKTGS